MTNGWLMEHCKDVQLILREGFLLCLLTTTSLLKSMIDL